MQKNLRRVYDVYKEQKTQQILNLTAAAIIPQKACTVTSCEGYYFLELLALKSVFYCKLRRYFWFDCRVCRLSNFEHDIYSCSTGTLSPSNFEANLKAEPPQVEKKWQATKYIRYTWKQIRIREKGDYSSWELRGTQNIYELRPKWAGHPWIGSQHDIKNDNKTLAKFLAVFKLYQNLGRMFLILEFLYHFTLKSA